MIDRILEGKKTGEDYTKNNIALEDYHGRNFEWYLNPINLGYWFFILFGCITPFSYCDL